MFHLKPLDVRHKHFGNHPWIEPLRAKIPNPAIRERDDVGLPVPFRGPLLGQDAVPVNIVVVCGRACAVAFSVDANGSRGHLASFGIQAKVVSVKVDFPLQVGGRWFCVELLSHSKSPHPLGGLVNGLTAAHDLGSPGRLLAEQGKNRLLVGLSAPCRRALCCAGRCLALAAGDLGLLLTLRDLQFSGGADRGRFVFRRRRRSRRRFQRFDRHALLPSHRGGTGTIRRQLPITQSPGVSPLSTIRIVSSSSPPVFMSRRRTTPWSVTMKTNFRS